MFQSVIFKVVILLSLLIPISLTTGRLNLEQRIIRETIQELYQKLYVTGNLADLPKSGRPKSARTEENIERVRESVNADQSTSLRKRSQELCLRTSSLRNIIVNDLILKPSKIQFTHKMFESDASERLTFVRDIENLTSQDENFLDKLIMTDEAHF